MTGHRFALILTLALPMILSSEVGSMTVPDHSDSSGIIPVSEIRKNDANGVPLMLGQSVTVAGEVTVSDQFGISASIEDETGGVVVYDGDFATRVEIGDYVVITGTITQFYGLTELTGVVIIEHIPKSPSLEPLIVTCRAIEGDGTGGVETYEGRLVRLDGVTANTDKWIVTGSGVNYVLTDASGTCSIRIDKDTDLVNTLTPKGQFDVIGVVQQYDVKSPFTSGYQLLPRMNDDIIVLSGPRLVAGPEERDMTPTSMLITWQTATPSNSIVVYGETPDYEIDSLLVDEAVTDHQVLLSGLYPATAYHIKVGSGDHTGTNFTADHLAMTSSDPSSSGQIDVYFNRSVDPSYAIAGNEAMGRQNLLQQFLVRANAANYSIDVCFYSWNLQDATDALINAHRRGVKVRFIHDDEHTYQNEVQQLKTAGITVITDSYGNNDGNGLQHNKFAIFDARDQSRADDDWVFTGSFNMTTDDKGGIGAMQNIIEIQDQSLSRAYTMEFDEMWGSDQEVPDANRSRFGARKTDDTPHRFIINGKQIEMYMSPSDRTTSKIIHAVNTADHELYFCILEFTRIDLNQAMADRFFNISGFQLRGVFDSDPDPSSQWPSMHGQGNYAWNPAADVWLDTEPGVMHHKYMIIDAFHADSDPIVITGSQNWSNSAETKNNENILIIHDHLIANQYVQEFVRRYTAAGGQGDFSLTEYDEPDAVPGGLMLYQNYPNPFNPQTTIRFSLDRPGRITLQLFDVRGAKVETLVDQFMQASEYRLTCSADNLASGIYLLQLKSDDRLLTKKIAVLK